MQILKTRIDIDLNWKRQIDQLDQLVRIAGSPKRLSKLLGVGLNSVYAWGRSGRISPLGALLVEHSQELGQFFTFEKLRPDSKPDHKAYLLKTKEFIKYRKLQLKFENSSTFKKDSVLFVLEQVGRCETQK